MSNPLHILMTADAVGGVWTYALELARALEPYEVTITLATMGPSPSADQQRDVARLPNVTWHGSDFALEWMPNAWADVDAAGEWLLSLESPRPDIVHLNGFAHASLPWQAPVVVVAHSCVCSWWRAVHHVPAPVRYAEYHRRVTAGLNAADLVIAPSEAMLEALDREYKFGTPRRVIANGCDPAPFRPAKKVPIIVSAGRVADAAKNVDLFSRVAPRLKHPVYIAGDARGVLQPGRKKRGKEPNPQFIGQLSRTELAQRLARASVYAAPARYEPFGLGILEAALSGCALALSDIPSLRETWAGAATFSAPDDEERWIAVVNSMVDNPLRSDRARRRAQDLSARTMAARYLESYRGLIRSERREPSEVFGA